MSSPTWTHVALSSEFLPFEGECWRLVEAQHRVSTLKLTDTLDEQVLLENLIEATKPERPPETRRLDYLLATPFRYDAVYPTGSRFRRAGRTPGVFYAAETPATGLAEIAFHRLLFFAESPSTPWPADSSDFTAFAVAVTIRRQLDLTREPLSRDSALWRHPTDYGPCQALADAARAAGAQSLRYASVRDPGGGRNLAVLDPDVFAKPAPVGQQTWRVRFSASGVQARCDFPRQGLEFPREAFISDPRIATLNWDRSAP